MNVNDSIPQLQILNLSKVLPRLQELIFWTPYNVVHEAETGLYSIHELSVESILSQVEFTPTLNRKFPLVVDAHGVFQVGEDGRFRRVQQARSYFRARRPLQNRLR